MFGLLAVLELKVKNWVTKYIKNLSYPNMLIVKVGLLFHIKKIPLIIFDIEK
jgi:hypothetical protein